MSKPSTFITDPELLANPMPGEILGFPRAVGAQPNRARWSKLRVSPRHINEIVRRPITADTDLRLTRYFGRTSGFFLGLQADYDLMARRRELGGDLELIEPRAA